MRKFPDNVAYRPPKERRPMRLKEFFYRPLVFGASMCVLIGGTFGGVNVRDWSHTEGLPREEVRVVAKEDTGQSDWCGGRRSRKEKPVYAVTYRSFDPPSGFPEEFMNFESCSVHENGEDLVVVRTWNDDDTLEVWFNHPDTLYDALWPAVLAGFGAGIFGAGVVYFSKGFSETRRGKHGRGPGRH